MTLRRRMTILSMTPLLCFGLARAGPLEDAQALFDARKYPEALKLVLPLAEKGEPAAQVLAGELNRFVGDNNVEAIRWFQKAADQGDADGQFNLGYMYLLTGAPGVKQDLPKALHWFKIAAKNGSGDAMAAIGGMYENGVGVARNSFKGLDWVRKGADRGSPGAYAKLGGWYHSSVTPSKEGIPVHGDKVEAYKWYWLAANSGARGRWLPTVDSARHFLEKMERTKEVTPEQIQQAMAAAKKHLDKLKKKK